MDFSEEIMTKQGYGNYSYLATDKANPNHLCGSPEALPPLTAARGLRYRCWAVALLLAGLPCRTQRLGQDPLYCPAAL
jgi:hypothetical protein